MRNQPAGDPPVEANRTASAAFAQPPNPSHSIENIGSIEFRLIMLEPK